VTRPKARVPASSDNPPAKSKSRRLIFITIEVCPGLISSHQHSTNRNRQKIELIFFNLPNLRVLELGKGVFKKLLGDALSTTQTVTLERSR
jgi:hypothetical protein